MLLRGIDEHNVVVAVLLLDPIQIPFPATLPIFGRTLHDHRMTLLDKLLEVRLAVQVLDARKWHDAALPVLPDALQHSLLEAAPPRFEEPVDAVASQEVIHHEQPPVARLIAGPETIAAQPRVPGYLFL